MNASVRRIGSVGGRQSAMGYGSNFTGKVVEMNDLEGSFGVQGEQKRRSDKADGHFPGRWSFREFDLFQPWIPDILVRKNRDDALFRCFHSFSHVHSALHGSTISLLPPHVPFSHFL